VFWTPFGVVLEDFGLFFLKIEKVYSTYARGAKQYGKKGTEERQKCFEIKMWVVD
jgi:hypothetical protein